MQNWYVQYVDHLIGPCSESEIIKYIKANRIPSNSYMCIEGGTDWYPSLDIEFCHSFFSGEQINMEVDLLPERQWVVLQVQDSGDYDQDGPFATREILSKIAIGDLDYSDRIWRPGFQTWERIGELKNFVPNSLIERKASVVEPQGLLTEESSEELLQSVAKLDGKDILEYAKELVPHEAEGEDLTRVRAKNRFNKELNADEINQMSFSLNENKNAEAAQASAEVRERWIPKNVRVEGLVAKVRSNFSRIFAASVLLFLVGFLLKHFIVIEPTATLEAKEKKITEYNKPSLRIYGVSLNSLRPRLEFRSNYDREDQVHVQITGRDGKILNHYRFNSSKSLTFVPGESVEMALAEEQLADGLYVIKASLGNLSAEKEVFIGVNDIQFESKLKRFNLQKKKRSELEKKILKSVATDLEKRTGELIKTLGRKKLSKVDWKSFYNSWKRKFYESAHTELRSFSNETTHKFVNVDEFRNLKELRIGLWKTTKEIKADMRKNSIGKIRSIRSDIQKF